MAGLFTIVAQPGFNRILDYNYKYAGVGHSILSNDTVYLLSSVIDYDSTNKINQGLCFATIDTSGNILSKKLIFDEKTLTFNPGNTITEIGSNKQFISISDLFYDSTALLLKFDRQGNLLLKKSINPIANYSSIYRSVLDIDGAIISFGHVRNKTSGRASTFVRCFDYDGVELWTKLYHGEKAKHLYFGSLKVGAAGIIFNATETNDKFPGDEQLTSNDYINIIFQIDSKGGVIKKSYFPSADNTTMTALCPTNDSSFVYGIAKALKFQPVPQLNPIYYYSLFLEKRDKQMNLKWSTPIGINKGQCHIDDIVQDKKGDFVLSGMYSRIGLDDKVTIDALISFGMVYKLSANGDSIWKRNLIAPKDTMNSKEVYFENRLYHCHVMPSGNILANGELKVLFDTVNSTHAWMVRLDENGCIQKEDCTGTPTVDIKNDTWTLVYPNPAQQYIHIKNSKEAQMRSVEIYDSVGKFLQKIETGNGNEQIDIAFLPNGIYFLKINNEDNKFTIHSFIKN